MAAQKPSRTSPRATRRRDPAASKPAAAEPLSETAPAYNFVFNRPFEKEATHVADYIAAITAELAAMAGGVRLDMLTYFLNMARLEAEFQARRGH